VQLKNDTCVATYSAAMREASTMQKQALQLRAPLAV
jgi:hypothetical protein